MAERMAEEESRADGRLPVVGGWLLLLLAAVAWAIVLVQAWQVCAAQGYSWLPLSQGALAESGTASRQGLRLAVGLLAALLLPALWARGRPRPRASLARAWALMAAVGLWTVWGYQFNRFGAGALWRRHVALAGLPIPEALTDLHTWAVNLGITAIAIGVALALVWPLRFLLGGLGRAFPGPSRRWPARVGGILLLLLLPLAVRPESWGRPRATGPDLILISLDATRADHLGCYGYDRQTTPNLDAFAKEAVRFDRAYSQEPWTLTSHMSMLTGLMPDAHGLDFGKSLAPKVWTLAERVREAGYRTWASVYDCFLLNPRFGYSAGFDHYEETGAPAAQRCEEAADWLLSSSRPAFVFLHLYDPHSDTGVLPYESPSKARDRLAPGAARGFAEWTGPGGASESLRKVNAGERVLPDSLQRQLRELYDAGLGATDAALGKFFQRLRRAGRLDGAMIIVLADHGEALGDRGHYMHERLMEATLHIPLLVHWPGAAGGGTVRDDLAETVDLVPTFLDAAGLAPWGPQQGRDLVRPTGRKAALSRSGPDYALTTDDGWRILYRWGPAGPELKALRRIDGSGGDGPDSLAARMDIVDRWINTIQQLHTANAALAHELGAGTAAPVGKDDEELLRSLGYIQ